MAITEILIKTYRTLISRKIVLIKSIIIPFCIGLLIEILSTLQIEQNIIQEIILGIVDLAIYTLIAINIHRIVILGDQSVPHWGIYTPTTREFSFFFHFILLSFWVIPFVVVFSKISFLFLPIGIIIYGYIVSRISLAFPAIAIDSGWTFKDSWKATKNHQILMIVSVVVIPISLKYILHYLLIPININFINFLINLFLTIILISLLSETYKYIAKTENYG